MPQSFPARERLLAMTFGYVLFSLLVQGLTVGRLIGWLGIQGSKAPPEPAGTAAR